jgi:hypothetical protein
MTARYENPDIRCVATSHSDEPSMNKWIGAVVGAGYVEIIVNADSMTELGLWCF